MGRSLGVVFSDGSGKSHHPKAIARVGWALTAADVTIQDEELCLWNFAVMLGGVHGAQTVPRSELTAAAWAGTAAAESQEALPSVDPSGVFGGPGRLL